MRRWLLLLFLPTCLAAYEGSLEGDVAKEPWFTGPILATSGNIVEVGHFNVEPYVYGFARTAFYNNDWSSEPIDTLWNVQFRAPVWTGITRWMDFKVTPVWSWNERSGRSQWTWGDWSSQASFQIHRDTFPSKSWLPSIKVTVRETFPTGKYQNLNPDKLGTDSTGEGSWTTSFSWNMSKIYHISGEHYLNLRLNFQYSLPTSVDVAGFNAYGGGIGTEGTVYPGQSGLWVFAFEYTLTRNWAIACDFQGAYDAKTTFQGYPGMVPGSDSDINPSGVPASNENQASIQYSLAPAIEYNWSDNLGLLAGVWMTIAGKNSSRFTTGVIALNYYR